MLDGKERKEERKKGRNRKKKERRKRISFKNKNEIFEFNFVDFEEKSWNSGAMFYNRNKKFLEKLSESTSRDGPEIRTETRKG